MRIGLLEPIDEASDEDRSSKHSSPKESFASDSDSSVERLWENVQEAGGAFARETAGAARISQATTSELTAAENTTKAAAADAGHVFRAQAFRRRSHAAGEEAEDEESDDDW